jgi:hypothetical protein
MRPAAAHFYEGDDFGRPFRVGITVDERVNARVEYYVFSFGF